MVIGSSDKQFVACLNFGLTNSDSQGTHKKKAHKLTVHYYIASFENTFFSFFPFFVSFLFLHLSFSTLQTLNYIH